MKIILIFSLFIFTAVHAQKTDHSLEKKITSVIDGFHGDVGVYIYSFANNKIVSINADSIFPTASMVKIPILIGVMHKIFNGELNYHQSMTYTDSLYYSEGDDMLSSFKSGEKIELSKLLLLMMSTSDNCASLWLQGLAGSGTVINKYLDSLGIKDTRVNSRTPGRQQDRSAYGWGQTTPKEMATLLKLILEKKIINDVISERMLRLMSRQYWDEEAISSIPPDVFVADKNGAVDASRSEVMYVKDKHPYILCICTKNNKDTSWNSNNEAWIMTRNISSLVWQYYNPKSDYKPLTLLK